MEREQARKLIGALFDQAVDDIETERLDVMRREIQAQMSAVQKKGLYQKALDALEMELQARGVEVEPHIRPQTPAETITSGYPEDKPGEIRHGVRREASKNWRVTGR